MLSEYVFAFFDQCHRVRLSAQSSTRLQPLSDLPMAPKRSVKKRPSHKGIGTRKLRLRDGHDAVEKVVDLRAQKRGISRTGRLFSSHDAVLHLGDGERRRESKQVTLSRVGKRCAVNSPKRTITEMVAEKIKDVQQKSATEPLEPGMIEDGGEGCGSCTPGLERQNTPEGMRGQRVRGDPLRVCRGGKVKSCGLHRRIHGDGGKEGEAEKVDMVEEWRKENEVYSTLPRMEPVQKFISAKTNLQKIKEDYYSVMVSLRLPQNEPERLVQKLKEKDVVIDSFREAARAEKRRGEKEEIQTEAVKKRRKYNIEVQERLYGFA